jgi:hypothetical protein
MATCRLYQPETPVHVIVVPALDRGAEPGGVAAGCLGQGLQRLPERHLGGQPLDVLLDVGHGGRPGRVRHHQVDDGLGE